MTTDRSYDAALEVVSEAFNEQDRANLDSLTTEAMDLGLLGEVFEQAWRLQFDEGGDHFKREAREIVTDAIEKVAMSEGSDALE